MDMTQIVFTGDISFDRRMQNKWEDPDQLSDSILDFFSGILIVPIRFGRFLNQAKIFLLF